MEKGIKDGSIRKDVDPLEIAMFVATTPYSVVKPDTNTLNAMRISKEQYYADFLDIRHRGLINVENKD